MHNKKRGQIGDTITWVVATVIIVLILAVSLFASEFAFGKSKDLSFLKTTDTLVSKSLFSYLLTKDSEGDNVYNQIKKQENLNEFNGNLGKAIFKKFYDGEYKNVWMGIITILPFSEKENDYFGERPSDTQFENTKVESASEISTETIKLSDDKAIQIVLLHK